MRPLLVPAAFAAGLLGGCNRMHLYKNAGQTTVNAFAVQAAGTNAPRPRGIDGDEATALVTSEKQSFSPGDDGTPGPGGGPGGAGAKPAGIPLQAR